MSSKKKSKGANGVVACYQAALLGSDDPGTTLVGEVNDVFTKYWSNVYRVCLRFVGNAEGARDLTQETMLTAFEKLHQFQGRAHFCTWLYSIARSVCLQALRKNGELLVEDGVLDKTDPEAGILSTLQRHERELLMRSAMKNILDAREQEAVYLRYVELLPQDRITTILGLTDKSGARGLLQRCRRKLGRELRKRLAELGHGSSFLYSAV